MAQTRRARRSAHSGRTFARGVPRGTSILRNRFEDGFCQGIEKTSGSVVSLVGLSETTSWSLRTCRAIKPHCALRRLLIIGSSAVVQRASKRGAPKGSWLEQMLARKPAHAGNLGARQQDGADRLGAT
jgi:hypothetical protein